MQHVVRMQVRQRACTASSRKSQEEAQLAAVPTSPATHPAGSTQTSGVRRLPSQSAVHIAMSKAATPTPRTQPEPSPTCNLLSRGQHSAQVGPVPARQLQHAAVHGLKQAAAVAELLDNPDLLVARAAALRLLLQ